jgi:hypothetical protein
MTAREVQRIAADAGFTAEPQPHRLPRGQVMFVA